MSRGRFRPSPSIAACFGCPGPDGQAERRVGRQALDTDAESVAVDGALIRVDKVVVQRRLGQRRRVIREPEDTLADPLALRQRHSGARDRNWGEGDFDAAKVGSIQGGGQFGKAGLKIRGIEPAEVQLQNLADCCRRVGNHRQLSYAAGDRAAGVGDHDRIAARVSELDIGQGQGAVGCARILRAGYRCALLAPLVLERAGSAGQDREGCDVPGRDIVGPVGRLGENSRGNGTGYTFPRDALCRGRFLMLDIPCS